MGRPDLLTPDTATRILDAVRAGASMKDAAAAAGIGERTVYDWVAREDEPGKYAQFSQDLSRARAEAKVAAVTAVRSAMGDDWRAAAFYLERRHSGEWGRRQALEHSGPGGGPVKVDDGKADLRGLSVEELRQLERLLAKGADAGADVD